MRAFFVRSTNLESGAARRTTTTTRRTTAATWAATCSLRGLEGFVLLRVQHLAHLSGELLAHGRASSLRLWARRSARRHRRQLLLLFQVRVGDLLDRRLLCVGELQLRGVQSEAFHHTLGVSRLGKAAATRTTTARTTRRTTTRRATTWCLRQSAHRNHRHCGGRDHQHSSQLLADHMPPGAVIDREHHRPPTHGTLRGNLWGLSVLHAEGVGRGNLWGLSVLHAEGVGFTAPAVT